MSEGLFVINLEHLYPFELRLMDGIAEATQCKDGAVCHSSVSCVGALLSALELIARGKGLNDKQVEIILKRAEQEEEERNYIPRSTGKGC